MTKSITKNTNLRKLTLSRFRDGRSGIGFLLSLKILTSTKWLRFMMWTSLRSKRLQVELDSVEITVFGLWSLAFSRGVLTQHQNLVLLIKRHDLALQHRPISGYALRFLFLSWKSRLCTKKIFFLRKTIYLNRCPNGDVSIWQVQVRQVIGQISNSSWRNWISRRGSRHART